MKHTSKTFNAYDYLYYLSQYWNDKCDPRTIDLPLMNGGPWKLLAILMVYTYFVTKLGPKLMSGRNAFELRPQMFLYNVTMVLINIIFLYQSLQWLENGTRLLDFKFPDNRYRSDKTMQIIRMFHYYFYTKFVDLIDTVIFVLRKKENHVTFLHVYHHVSVPVICWISLWVSPLMPIIGLTSLINCFCHVIMYSYYALSGLGPDVRIYLWWKRYITQIQIAQFIIVIIYAIILNLFHIDYPLIMRILPISQGLIFLTMFSIFYINSYLKSNDWMNRTAIKLKII